MTETVKWVTEASERTIALSSRRASKSNAWMLPVFCKMAARWLVLFPGAAHASMQRAPRGGERQNAEKQLASWSAAAAQPYFILQNHCPRLVVFVVVEVGLACKWRPS